MLSYSVQFQYRYLGIFRISWEGIQHLRHVVCGAAEIRVVFLRGCGSRIPERDATCETRLSPSAFPKFVPSLSW